MIGSRVTVMTITEIRERVREIRKAARDGDHEHAHTLEDDLHRRVLEMVASGQTLAGMLAREALATRRIRIKRWTA
jgi:DNA-binding GntR family transcriptional regulator